MSRTLVFLALIFLFSAVSGHTSKLSRRQRRDIVDAFNSVIHGFSTLETNIDQAIANSKLPQTFRSIGNSVTTAFSYKTLLQIDKALTETWSTVTSTVPLIENEIDKILNNKELKKIWTSVTDSINDAFQDKTICSILKKAEVIAALNAISNILHALSIDEVFLRAIEFTKSANRSCSDAFIKDTICQLVSEQDLIKAWKMLDKVVAGLPVARMAYLLSKGKHLALGFSLTTYLLRKLVSAAIHCRDTFPADDELPVRKFGRFTDRLSGILSEYTKRIYSAI